MKRNPGSDIGWKIHSLFKILLAVGFSIINLTSSAQQNAYSTVNSPDLFIEKNPNSPLVKYYLADPGNARAFTAIEYSVLLSNGDQQLYKDEQRMHNLVSEVTSDAIKFEKYTAQGLDSKSAAKRVSSQPTVTPVSEKLDNSKPVSNSKIKIQPSEQEYSKTKMQAAPSKTKNNRK